MVVNFSARQGHACPSPENTSPLSLRLPSVTASLFYSRKLVFDPAASLAFKIQILSA